MKMTERIRETVKLSIGTILQAISILAIVLLSFAYVKAQADTNAHEIASHKVDDEKRWADNTYSINELNRDIEEVKNIQTEIRLAQRETTTHYSHILSEIEKLSNKFEQYEVVK